MLVHVWVDYSDHDALKEGVTALGTKYVVCEAESECEGILLACQMVARNGMPTAARLEI